MNAEEAKELKRQLDKELTVILKAMDDSPVIQKVTRMTVSEIEALPQDERRKLQSGVLKAINEAKRKARSGVE